MRLIMVLSLCCIPLWAHAAPKTATDKIVDSFMAFDSDMSDGVSEAEYQAMVQQRAEARFQRMDRNHDGEVSADEYRIFWKHEQAAYYRLQH